MIECDVTPLLKSPPIRSKRHLHLVSYLGCVVPGCRWWLPPEMIARRLALLTATRPRDVEQMLYVTWHHVRRSSNAGTAVTPGDDFAVGLCNSHHIEGVHRRGERTCSAEWGIDLMVEAARLAAAGRMLGFLPAIAV